MVDIADVVNYTDFGDDRLRGFWVAGGQISPSPIDFHRRPYNTLALPCERVIPIKLRPQVQAQLQELQSLGIIRPSKSPMASPVICVLKGRMGKEAYA